jgi:hypothetical protein
MTNETRERYRSELYRLLMQVLLLQLNTASITAEDAGTVADAWTDALIELVPIDALGLVFEQAFRLQRDSSQIINAVDLRLAWESLQPEERYPDQAHRTFDLMHTIEFSFREDHDE